jgi:hypothetical protein
MQQVGGDCKEGALGFMENLYLYIHPAYRPASLDTNDMQTFQQLYVASWSVCINRVLRSTSRNPLCN